MAARSRHRRERGSTMIEMAFVLPIMFSMIFGIFEFGRVFYMQLTLTSAVREASRFAVTGNSQEGQTRAESIVSAIGGAAPGLGIQPADISISGPGGPGDAGGPGDLVTISVQYEIDLLTPIVAAVFPNGKHQFTVTMITRNEPFPEI